MPIALTRSKVSSGDGSVESIRYATIAETDTDPAPIELTEFADRSVQVDGTFNGGTLTVEGSNDGLVYLPLSDPQGNALAFTSAKIEQVQEMTRFIRPRVTAGTGVSLNVTFLVRRASSLRT